jgi:type II pantothenate kinase
LVNSIAFRVDKEDEMDCLIKGCNFLLKNIPDEAFLYQRHDNPEYLFQNMDSESIFPHLLVNIGSGVSLFKVS